MYGTNSGNAELVAEAIADGLSSNEKITVSCSRAEILTAKKAVENDLIVLVSSTYNVGQLNDYIVKFNKELSEMNLPNKFIEVVGLGDSKYYDIFCGAADILESTVKKVGATQLMETIRIDGQPHNRLEEMKKWGIELGSKLVGGN